MKYSLKNICVNFGGWSLEFARVRKYDFIDYRSDFVNISDDKYNEEGGLNTDLLSRDDLRALRNVTPSFLAENLLSAKCDDQEAKTEKEKLTLIDFLSDNDDFITFVSGYINGEKKT